MSKDEELIVSNIVQGLLNIANAWQGGNYRLKSVSTYKNSANLEYEALNTYDISISVVVDTRKERENAEANARQSKESTT